MVPIEMSSSFNNTNVYDLWCPEGFVFPDDPSNPLNEWITNSSCAVACMKPMYTDATYNSRQNVLSLLSWIGALSICALLITHYKQGKALGCLTLCKLFYAGLLSLTFIIAGQYPLEDQYCHDNSTTVSQSDGLTFCAFEALVCCYTGVGIVVAW